MAYTLTRSGLEDRGVAPVVGGERRARPVLWFAGLGAGFCCLAFYLWARWIMSGNFRATPTGATPVPTYMVVAARAMECLNVVAVISIFWFVLVRPWRRQGRITFDGMLFIAGMLMYWQDLLCDFSGYQVSYNSVFLNRGSWFKFVPGWVTPNAERIPEPLLGFGLAYAWAIVGYAIVANWLMRRAKARWPRVGTMGMVSIALGMGMVTDFLAELVFVRTGMFIYPGAIRGLTLWYGHWYQFPIYETLLWGTGWGAIASFRYFRDDHGRSFAERGIDRIKFGPKAQTGLRFLAVVAATQLLFLAIYNIPMQLFALNSGSWPAEVQQRSYFTMNVCGPASEPGPDRDRPGTRYACPGPDVPIPRPRSAAITPEGDVFRPGEK